MMKLKNTYFINIGIHDISNFNNKIIDFEVDNKYIKYFNVIDRIKDSNNNIIISNNLHEIYNNYLICKEDEVLAKNLQEQFNNRNNT